MGPANKRHSKRLQGPAPCGVVFSHLREKSSFNFLSLKADMKRKIQLDGVRGMALLMVFSYHALHVHLFWAGVDLFFVLSGYLITGILIRMKEKLGSRSAVLKSFYGRRACRILPPLLLFLLVGSLVYHTHWLHILGSYAFFNANFTIAFNKGVLPAFNPLWSLAVEEQFYLMWPLVVLLTSLKTLKRVSLGIIVIDPILRALFTPYLPHLAIYWLTPFRMDTLVCGAAIAIFEYEDRTFIESRHRQAAVCVVAAGALFCVLSMLPTFRRNADTIFFNSLGYSLVVLIFGGAILYALGTRRGGSDYSVLTLRPLRYMGQISYTFYLYHHGVLGLIERDIHSTLGAAFFTFAITGAIAAVSWPYFESPFLRLRRPTVAARRNKQRHELVATAGATLAVGSPGSEGPRSGNR
jgi:peptidoglycan/LPS O-acetylase OafA/YrhL